MRWLAMVAVVMVAVVMAAAEVVQAWNCVCNPSECESLEPSGCPGQGYLVWDPCRCCQVCARTLGEDCGEFKGTCEPKLQCIEGTCTT